PALKISPASRPEGVPVRTCPARSSSTDQAAKLRPQAKRRQVVDSDEDHEREEGREAGPERPFLRLRLQRPPTHGFDRVEEQMTSIQHGNWKEVDEPEIDGNHRHQP